MKYLTNRTSQLLKRNMYQPSNCQPIDYHHKLKLPCIMCVTMKLDF